MVFYLFTREYGVSLTLLPSTRDFSARMNYLTVIYKSFASELIIRVQNLLQLLNALDRRPQNLHFWQALRGISENTTGHAIVYDATVSTSYRTAHLFRPSYASFTRLRRLLSRRVAFRRRSDGSRFLKSVNYSLRGLSTHYFKLCDN